MRIGSTPASTHAAGMSALWHDADYMPEKQLRTPSIEKGLNDLPLPSEQHQLPKGAQDAFAKLDQIYDVAGQQMERGLEGQAFLHGKNAPARAELPDEVTRTLAQPGVSDAQRPENQRFSQEGRAVSQQIDAREQAGSAPPKVSNATQPSDAKQRSQHAQKALELAEGLGVSVGAMAVSQALDPSGALGAQAASAASAVKAVSVAKTAASMASSMEHENPTLRRGIRGHQPSLDGNPIGHQPSLDPGER